MATEAAPPTDAPAPPQPAIPKKTYVYVGLIFAAMWGFAIYTGSLVVEIIVGVLTLVVAGLLIYALRMVRKQRALIGTLQGATQSPEARREALAKLEVGKDADEPTNLFARAQLMAQDDAKGALAVLDKKELKTYPAAMQDDVALLKTQLLLGMGRTQDARKVAETINLDNPSRKEVRTMAAVIVAEAFARTGKPKEALALVDSIEPPKKDAEQILVQARVVKVFAKFAMNQRPAARAELRLARRRRRQLPRPLPHAAVQGAPRAAEARAPGPRGEPGVAQGRQGRSQVATAVARLPSASRTAGNPRSRTGAARAQPSGPRAATT